MRIDFLKFLPFFFLALLSVSIAQVAEPDPDPDFLDDPMVAAGLGGDIAETPNPATLSILFTAQEYSALREARNYEGVARPTDVFEDFDSSDEEELQLPPQEQRFITLSGIAYSARDKWTIWLNGERVTPDALPEDILDLRVYKSYIEMRWYDKYTKRIMPIRLRANQRFHLDARIFLPG